MQDLAGKVAVVTGAGSGIGRALAERFAAEDMAVGIADVDASALGDAAAALRAGGASISARVTDVSDASAVDAFADQVFDELGAAHVLCNNAGVFAGGVIWERPTSDFEWVLGVNFWGILHGIRAFVPRMIEQGTEGHVVNTISAAGLFASPYTAPYNVAKFAAFAATECLAGDLAASGSPIKVSALCPGAVLTKIGSSERNRPANLAAPSTPDAEFVTQMLVENTERGMPAADVAGMVIDAMRAERFMVLTSESYGVSLSRRTEELLAGAVPSLPSFE